MKAARTSLIFAFAVVAIANVAYAAALRIDDLVGTSIGTDFLLDPSFGDAGSTIVDFNDASIVTYASLRLVSDAGHYWLIGRNLTNRYYALTSNNLPGGLPGEIHGVVSRSRELALQASYKF